MRFAFPAALWLLPLALLPLLARKTRPARRLAVGAHQFWAPAVAREAAPLPRRLRRDRVALVQAGIVATIVLALARPWWTPGDDVAAIVMDTSLSMSAVSGGQSRLALAVRRAAEWTARLPPGTRVRLITTAPVPRQIAELPADGDSIERALAGLRPTDAAARVDAAVAMARTGDPAPARVLVVTDAGAPADGAGTEWVAVGAPSENAAIVTLRARRARATAPDADVTAHVRNYGTRPLATTLTLAAGDRILLRQRLEMDAGSGTSATVVTGAGVVTATIDTADAIAADNMRATVVSPPLAMRVALTGMTDPDGFLERALRSRQGIEIVPDVARADVVVCAGCGPDATAGAPATAGLLIVPPLPATPTAPAPLARAGTRGGLPTPPGLDGIEAVAIDGAKLADGTVAVRAGQRPAVVSVERNGRRIVELRLDLARSPLSLTPAFPILVSELVDWLSLRDLEEAAFDAGTTVVRTVPRDTAGTPAVIGPRGASVATVVDGGRIVVADTSTAGVYRVRSGTADAPFVVNPAVNGESDLGAAAPPDLVAAAPAPRESAARADLTAVVLGGALLLIALEWRLRPGSWRSPRAVTVMLLAAAFAVPRIPWGEAPRAIVFALDVSDSMDARRTGALAFLRASTARMRDGDRSGLVVFGAAAAVERPLDAAPIAGAAVTARVPSSATNLEQAVRSARAALPDDGTGRVVLVTDGRATAGDVRGEILTARAAGVPIDVMTPPSGRVAAGPVVTRLSAPPTVHQGEPFEVRATVEGTPGARTVVVFDGGGEPMRRPIALPESGAATVAATIRPDTPGLAVYRASIEATDALADFARGPVGGVVAVAGEAQLLYVASRAPIALPGGYRVTHTPPEDVGRTAAALAPFDVVVLDDVEPEQLDEPQRRVLAQHVEQGGGLFVLGSPASLTPGGRDPLEAALPIDLRPRRGQRAPGLALVVVFDKSGSMDDRIDGAPRIEFARQAVERVLASLPPTDAVGVIAFDSDALDVAPLRPGHEPATLAERLAGVRPSGATAIAPAVERAVAWLRGPAASGYARRLVLLVSDGRTSPADQARARTALRSAGIEVSTVALGDEADRRFLGELASAGNGRAFYPRRLGELPALAAREAVRVSGGHVVDEPFTVQPARHPVLVGLDTGAMPTLGGYVVGSPKPGSEVALRSPLGDPVLALWRHGLGKVAVYTADWRSPWSAGLRAWPDAPALLAQTTRWLSRRVEHPFLHAAIGEHDGRLAVAVDARDGDGAFLSGLDVRAQARTPAGETRDLAFAPAAPGLYEASLPLADPGPYLFSIAATAPDGSLDARIQRGFFWASAQERAGEPDTATLAEVARLSGGRMLSADGDPFGGPRPRDRRDIAPWLAALALPLFLRHVFRPSASRATRRGNTDRLHREAA